jgi:hypothetical protein
MMGPMRHRRPNEGMVLAALLTGCGGETPTPVDGEVEIIRGADGETWLDLTIAGQDLNIADGNTVVIQIGTPDFAPERLGHAVTQLAGGGFSVDFPDVWEHGLYKKKVIFFDLDDDGACDGTETVLVDFSASLDDRVLTATAPLEPGGIWGDFFLGTCAELVADWPSE